MKRAIVQIILMAIVLLPANLFAFGYTYDQQGQMVLLGGDMTQWSRWAFSDEIPDKRDPLWRNIYSYQIELDQYKVIYQAKEKMRISYFEISESGNLAIVENEQPASERWEETGDFVIINGSGSVIFKVSGVLPSRYNGKTFIRWNKSGDKIAFIKGTYVPETKGPLHGEVWIYDLASKTEKKIHEYSTEINWSEHDGKLYIEEESREGPVTFFVYDPATEKITPSKHKGIYFSSDGQYCFGSNWVDNDNMYGTSFERVYTIDPETNMCNNRVKSYKAYGRFIPNTHKMILWGYDFMGGNIYDPEKNTFSLKRSTSRKDDKGLLGWNKDMTRVLVYVGNDTVQIQNMLTGQVLKSFKLPK